MYNNQNNYQYNGGNQGGFKPNTYNQGANPQYQNKNYNKNYN
jgi:hypothetical protein